MLTCGKIYVKIFDVANKLCYCGSMAEQLIRNEQVVSSILTSSSKLNPCKQCAYRGGFTLKARFSALICVCLFLHNFAYPCPVIPLYKNKLKVERRGKNRGYPKCRTAAEPLFKQNRRKAEQDN